MRCLGFLAIALSLACAKRLTSVTLTKASGCRDQWNPKSCQAFTKKHGCDLQNARWGHIIKLCKSTCGLCGARRISSCRDVGHPALCRIAKDHAKICEPLYSNPYLSVALTLCRQTCGLCFGGGGKKATTAGQTVPPTTNTEPSTDSGTTAGQPGTDKPSTKPNKGGGNKPTGSHCPKAAVYGKMPAKCVKPTDPNNKPKSKLESWFTKEMFDDLFPGANLGLGPSECLPYSYEAFSIAARYFPRFGTESPNKDFTPEENYKRDLASFFSHAIQETGENNADLYARMDKEKADDCFYRGGFYNWYEGGPTSSFLPKDRPGHQPADGKVCIAAGKYCANDKVNQFYFPCSEEKDGEYFKGCYFGRGAIQISYNFNYGLFGQWLNKQGIKVDLLKEPYLVMTKMDPPLSVLASMWFYMTPQPPKPAMHDIVMGVWEAGTQNTGAGYSGPIFGPTSLVINNECGGEDEKNPGGPGESRRIKAFKWFARYFDFPVGDEKTLTCKNMKVRLAMIKHNLSYAPDWSTTWKAEPCQCAPAAYAGAIPYYQEGFYPDVWVKQNADNKKRCEDILYSNPEVFSVDKATECLKHKA